MARFGKTHGMSQTRTYYNWKGMVARCVDKGHKDYPKYGGRGISVCDSWRQFVNFYADMGDAPAGRSIDRLDNDGHYCKENCAWRTLIEQNRNKRNTKRFAYHGENLTIKEWSEKTGIPYPRLKARVTTYQWPIERALTT